jgi:hypothetical protein
MDCSDRLFVFSWQPLGFVSSVMVVGEAVVTLLVFQLCQDWVVNRGCFVVEWLFSKKESIAKSKTNEESYISSRSIRNVKQETLRWAI